jgi:hypothetical protein
LARARHPFDAMLGRIEEERETLLGWRRGFSHCADRLSEEIAAAFDAHRDVGDFQSLSIDTRALAAAFRQGVQRPFDEEHFDRFHGPALGSYHEYDIATGREQGSSVLYSVWDDTVRVGGAYVQRITGSDSGHYETNRLPDLSENKVDLTVNVFRDDVGITGWVSKYQHGREEMTSVTYEIGKRRLLWMNKSVTKGGAPVRDNVFFVTLEWADSYGGRLRYYGVGLAFDIDFEGCRARPVGDTLSKAHYSPA